MIDIAILRAMVAAGASAEMLLAAIELATKPDVERRKRDADRKREWRARQRPRTSADVTGPSGDPPHAYTTPPIEKPKKVSLSRGARISDDWIASAEDVAFARQYLLDDNAIAEEEAKFRDYWKARPGAGGRKVDWSATWRNWVRNNRRPNGRAAGNGRHQETWKEKRQRETYEAIQQLKSYNARSDDPIEGDDPGDPFAGVIPFPKPA